MLRAYFDDSGTHGKQSPVVLMGGLIGNTEQWLTFESHWRAKLFCPLPEKPPLKRFHMSHCMAREGEFKGWTEAETDVLVHDLRQIILQTDLQGYACAISTAGWDAHIRGSLRKCMGDAEQFASISVFLQCLEWARGNTLEEAIQFVFDNRPHRNEANARVHSAFQVLAEEGIADRPKPLGISFFSSENFPPLQGADLVAWEYFNYASAWERSGRRPVPRKHLERLMESGRFSLQYGDKDACARMASQSVHPELADQLASLFRLPT